MRTFNKYFLLSCLILTVLPYVSFSQTVEDSAKLKALSAELNQKYQLEHTRALEIADSLGLPVRKTYEDGRTILLEKFENGLPVYKTTHNSEGAIMLNTDVVQPGGSTALDLDGNGQTIGIWDAGNPKSNHQQLTGRVNLLDASSIDGHATHVTGTLIADGTGDAQAKGMAPAAEVDSYDFGNDKTEMSDAASLGLLNSVHPYGYLVGWVFDTVTLKSGASATGWTWRGSASWSEDHNFGFYDNDNAKVWDQIAYDAPNYLIVTSAGNDRGKGPQTGDDRYEFDGNDWISCGTECNTPHETNGGSNGYDTLSDNSIAKNVLVVGAVDSSAISNPSNGGMWSNSNWGPTDDGRIKPDIVAKGVSVYSTNGGSITDYGNRTGTSFSAPMISGSAALLQELHSSLYSDNPILSSTLRGLISHTATDLGPNGPDYQFGWGFMNTQKAAELMQANFDNNRIHIRELTIRNGQTLDFTIKARGGEPLRATIAWTDPPGTPVPDNTVTVDGQTYNQKPLDPSDLMLVNDLDMRLIDSGNQTFYPYTLDPSSPGTQASTSSDNFRDNIEVTHVQSPVDGEIFTVTIKHKNSLQNGEPQDFSLIISGNEGVDYQQTITEGNGEGWRFLSSPTATASYSELLSNIRTQGPKNSDDETASLNNSNVFLYDGLDYKKLENLNSTIPAGSGTAVFFFNGDANKTLSVNGLDQIEDLSVDNLLNPGNNAYTLLGNPFNSTIDFDLFTNTSDVGNVVYVYDHACNISDPLNEPGNGQGGCFLAWSKAGTGSLTDGLIAPFQGFMVYATGPNPTMTIPENSKTSGGSFFKRDQKQNPTIQITATLNDSLSGITWISFTANGSLDRNSYDAPYLYPLDYQPFLSLQTHFEGTGYNIKTLPAEPEAPVIIPLSTEAWEPNQNLDKPRYHPIQGEVEIKWPKLENIPDSWTVTLKDRDLGTITDMKSQSHYRYSTSPQKQLKSTMPFRMGLQKAVGVESANTRFAVTVYPNGESQQLTESDLPNSFHLHQNYPNPFNPSTLIRYDLPSSAKVTLDVYSVSGKHVANLVNQTQKAGSYTVPFNAKNLASGIYFYQIRFGNLQQTQKMVLLK